MALEILASTAQGNVLVDEQFNTAASASKKARADRASSPGHQLLDKETVDDGEKVASAAAEEEPETVHACTAPNDLDGDEPFEGTATWHCHSSIMCSGSFLVSSNACWHHSWLEC